MIHAWLVVKYTPTVSLNWVNTLPHISFVGNIVREHGARSTDYVLLCIKP